jgi:nicotinamide-nucleotide amidase
MVEACICTIGDEILIGQIVDSNSAYIARELNGIGVKVNSIISIGDDFELIFETLKETLQKYNLIIITGGLGPTKDDITKKVISLLTGDLEMVYDTVQLDLIEKICLRRGIALSGLNRDQALVPISCTVLPNYRGTAPGMFFKPKEYPNKLLFSLPGVPYEMEALMESVCNTILKEYKPENIFHKTIATYGMAESSLADYLDKWESSLPHDVKLAYLPNPATGIKLRLSIYSGEKESSVKKVEILSAELKELLGEIVYGEGSDTLESVVYDILKDNKLTLSIAESCTGGRISGMITSIPGSSEIFMGGVVAYSNNSKIDILGVNGETIEQFGAVSRECAEEMASGIRNLLNSDYSLAVTGITGPSGGTPNKPTGTVWVAVSSKKGVISESIIFAGDRERNTVRFASFALNKLRLELKKHL